MKNKIPKLMVIMMAVALFFFLILSGCATLKSAVGGSAEVPQVERVSGEQTTKDMANSETTAAAETTAASGDYVAQEGSSDYNTAIIASGKIIKTASIQLEVKKGEFEKIFFEISAIATQNNGFVSNSKSYSDKEGKLTSGNIQIRVDQKNFDSVIDKIKALGTVKSVALGGQDISQEYTDLQSRLKNFQAQEQVLLDLMKQSTNVKDSIEVEKELTNVQGEIEVIKGRLNYLDNMVSFSTIDVSLAEPQAITSAQSGGFIDAVKRGASGALTVLKGMTVVFIVISPILVIIAIILIIIWQSIRARNRKRATVKKV